MPSQAPRNRVTDAARWRAGDHATQAKAKGPHGLSRYAKRSGHPASTLRRWARVAEAFPPRRREYPGVRFSHFEAAASAPDRFDLLARASKENWPVARVRREVEITAVASAGPDEGVRELGPQTLDAAIEYCGYLAAANSASRLGVSVRERLTQLAGVAGGLVACVDNDPGPG